MMRSQLARYVAVLAALATTGCVHQRVFTGLFPHMTCGQVSVALREEFESASSDYDFDGDGLVDEWMIIPGGVTPTEDYVFLRESRVRGHFNGEPVRRFGEIVVLVRCGAQEVRVDGSKGHEVLYIRCKDDEDYRRCNLLPTS